MSALPTSVLLAAWLGAVRDGHAGPDDLAAAVRGEDPRHLVLGLPRREVVELHELPTALWGHQPGQVSITPALPVPGDLVGLGGPPAFNYAAVEAGEAVVVGDLGLVPELDARTVVWRARAVAPAPWVDERETAAELRIVLSDVTRRLVDLDVAAWQPDIPDLLLNLRHRSPLPLPPGYDARRVETVERAVLCLDIVELARSGAGGAVSAYEMGLRESALAGLDRAARRALVGACSCPG